MPQDVKINPKKTWDFAILVSFQSPEVWAIWGIPSKMSDVVVPCLANHQK